MSSIFTMLSSCFRAKRRYSPIPGNLPQTTDAQPLALNDELLWQYPLTKTAAGEFSFAAVQANSIGEDHGQVETSSSNTFLAVHDGHGGPQASQFLNERLYPQFQRVLEEEGGVMSVDVINRAFAETEAEFVELVRSSWHTKPQMAAVGSCCLVGVISGETLYVASLGDSRAVLGTYRKANGVVAAVQLSTDHNANYESIRQELRMRYPQEKDIVVEKGGVWRVKGIIQVSRAIGDVYLKSQEFQADPLIPRFRLPEPLRCAVLLAEPTVIVRALRSPDQFVIFASDGLWEHISNQEAVDMVHAYPRAGIAQRLVLAALSRASKKRGMTYAEVKSLGRGRRRQVHDDISVVVFFFDHSALSHNRPTDKQATLSVKTWQQPLEGPTEAGSKTEEG